MDKAILMSGLFVGKCILFSASLRIYMQPVDKDNKVSLLFQTMNVIYLSILFHQIINGSGAIYAMLNQ